MTTRLKNGLKDGLSGTQGYQLGGDSLWHGLKSHFRGSLYLHIENREDLGQERDFRAPETRGRFFFSISLIPQCEDGVQA